MYIPNFVSSFKLDKTTKDHPRYGKEIFIFFKIYLQITFKKGDKYKILRSYTNKFDVYKKWRINNNQKKKKKNHVCTL